MELAHEHAPLLTLVTIIFQKSLVIGAVPADWKEVLVNVILIYKKGEPYNLANHHSVSWTAFYARLWSMSPSAR